MIMKYGDYEVDDDPERVDVDAAWAFLVEHGFAEPPATVMERPAGQSRPATG